MSIESTMSALASALEPMRDADGRYPHLASTSDVEAVAGTSAPAGESWEVVPLEDVDVFGWLLRRATATQTARNASPSRFAYLSHDWQATWSPPNA
jgi:hypothetical protein